jgi:hypothetical protein
VRLVRAHGARRVTDRACRTTQRVRRVRRVRRVTVPWLTNRPAPSARALLVSLMPCACGPAQQNARAHYPERGVDVSAIRASVGFE